MRFESWLRRERRELERRLKLALPGARQYPQRLHAAMRDSVLGGGKRLRPLLCRAAAQAISGHPQAAAWPPALALELLHAYSLIHDDLPALDNDAWRRGRPTCHKAYGETTAILAGDGLQALAFAQLGAVQPPVRARAMLRVLATAAGTPNGMVGGQMADMLAPGERATPARLAYVHRHKTAALIRAALVLGGLAAGADRRQLRLLHRFGSNIGLAFQIVDDLLDLDGDPVAMGKSTGKDQQQHKLTYPSLYGREKSQRMARRLEHAALATLATFASSAEPLRELTMRMVERQT